MKEISHTLILQYYLKAAQHTKNVLTQEECHAHGEKYSQYWERLQITVKAEQQATD